MASEERKILEDRRRKLLSQMNINISPELEAGKRTLQDVAGGLERKTSEAFARGGISLGAKADIARKQTTGFAQQALGTQRDVFAKAGEQRQRIAGQIQQTDEMIRLAKSREKDSEKATIGKIASIGVQALGLATGGIGTIAAATIAPLTESIISTGNVQPQAIDQAVQGYVSGVSNMRTAKRVERFNKLIPTDVTNMSPEQNLQIQNLIIQAMNGIISEEDLGRQIQQIKNQRALPTNTAPIDISNMLFQG